MSFIILIPSFTTQSGQYYISEEGTQQQQKAVQYYALKPSQYFRPQAFLKEQKKLPKNGHFRNYIKLQSISSNGEYYLFSHINGQTIAQKIMENRSKSQNIAMAQINVYLTHILNALYQLHQENILGRVFSTQNIIENEDGIFMMDFGYASDIYKSEFPIDILAPPEVVEGFNNISKQGDYDLKLDSWLLGAFLFHLGKQDPINTKQENNKNFFYKYSTKEFETFDAYLKQKQTQSPHIIFQTKRYPDSFCSLVEGLLKYNQNQRLSFSQIYKNEHVAKLNIPNIQKIISFYENLERNFNQSIICKLIFKYEKQSNSRIIRTGDLICEDQNQQIQPQLQQQPLQLGLISQLKSDVPKNLDSKDTPTTDIDLSNFQDITNMYPYFFSQFQDSKYKLIWIYINMEQFKFCLLNITAEEVLKILGNTNFGLEHLTYYYLKKMSIIILRELLETLKNTNSPWKKITNDQWLQFVNLNDNSKFQLESELIRKCCDIEDNLKIVFDQHCEKFINDERIDKIISDDLNQDKISNTAFSKNSSEFLYLGFRQVTNSLFTYLNRTEQIIDETRAKQSDLKLMTVFCHLINRIFILDEINNQFKFIRNIKSDYLSPNEIFYFIKQKDNESNKQKEIDHLMMKYFSK